MFKAALKQEIKVPAHIDYLGELRNFVTKSGRKHHFPDSVVNSFKLCIDEAATNIIKHAYRDWEGMITMRIIIKKASMTVVLIDQGKYFDPSRVDDPDLKRYVDIGKKGGLGIFIMRKLLDEIEYHHTEEGNELRLTKYRDSSFRKKSSVVPAVSFSMSLKTKYSFFAAIILTIAITIGYSYFFIRHGILSEQQFIKKEKPLCEDIARIIRNEGEDNFSPTSNAINTVVSDFLNTKEEIYRIIVVDIDNSVIYSTDEKHLVLTEFKIPATYETPRPGLIKYKLNKDVSLYSFSSDVLSSETDEKIGTVYLEVDTNYVKKDITSARLKDLKIALLILLAGYLGTMILIYIIMNPFRKLSTWVKDLGHGNVKDEIDFDTSDEVGEIAKAFSEITDKFRQSQKNLAEQERIQKEMQLAQDIQQTLLPASVPQLEGYEIASFYESAKEVGGDYYDFVEVDKDTLGIVVADVSGKGVPGSLIMTMIRTALRTEARSLRSASEVLARVNDFVVNDMKKGMFVTLFYVIIDSKKRRINYASAGHNPMILFRKSTNKTYYLNPRGFPVGISLPDPELFKKSIESDTIQLAEDDILLIYTDGITEAMNGRREMFSEERLQRVIRDHGDLKAEDFVEKLKDDIHSFSEGYEQNDDITVVAIKEKSTPEKIELTRAQNAHRMILHGKNIREACENAGITTYAYYNKYKKIFEEEGIDAYSIDDTVAVEAKHLSIEEKTKIYDIIKNHPEFGAKRISEELNAERYGYTEINESRIYDELVRSRLNTRQLREAYIARSGKKKRMKPPGTPMMTLDGKIIINKSYEEIEEAPIPEPPIVKKIKEPIEKEDLPEIVQEKEDQEFPKDTDDNFYLESLMTIPIEELLKKRGRGSDDQEFDNLENIDSQNENIKQDEELEDDDFFDEINNDSVIDEIDFADSYSDSMDEQSVTNDHESEIENSLDHDDIGIEQDFSFSDLWHEQGEEEEENQPENHFQGEEIDAVDEQITIQEEDEVIESQPPDDTEVEQLLESSGKIEDFVDIEVDSSTKKEEEIDFEMLTEDTSFRSEIVFDDDVNGNGAADKSEETDEIEDEFIEEPVLDLEIESFDEDLEININSIKYSENGVDENDEINLTDDDDLLEDDDLKYDDFSFNDLLNEIENDISFYEENDSLDDDAELVLEGSPPEYAYREAMSASYKDGDATLISEFDDERTILPEQDRLREKHLLLGLKFYQECKYEQAVEQFVRVIEIYPDFKEAFSILGNAYYRNNQAELAINSYNRVKKLDPDDVDAYENTGVIYANMGKYKEAIEEWEKVVELNPDRNDVIDHISKARELLKKNNKITVKN